MKSAAFAVFLVCTAFAQSSINVTVFNHKDTAAGAHGRFQNFLSTSFQPAEWDYPYFQQVSGSTGPLWLLAPQHIRIQPVSQGVPMTAPDQWDFTDLDAVLIPILSLGDHSPELQLATAPNFMDDSNGHLLRSHFQDFAKYCANIVRYYNTGGFDAGGKHYQSSSPYGIHWWGIFNEPNINGIAVDDYVSLYNMVVPAMLAVDPTIKLVGIELSDFQGQAQQYLPPFVQGVTAQVDAIATHYYSTCNQADTDETLMDSIWNFFVPDMHYLYSELRTNPKLANIPVWVTENNVNADYDQGNGISACNGTPFVTDQRGTSAFFAAWRPFIYSQLAKAGAESLYQWDYNADPQFGEVDYNTGNTYLSYWVDYYLAHLFPSPPGADILHLDNRNSGALEALAVRNDDGSVVIMLANHHLRSSIDNNGPGVPHTINLDLSALGAFSAATEITLDSSTDPSKGPVPHQLKPAAHMQIASRGYSVTFLRLSQAAPQFQPHDVVNAASYVGGGVSSGEMIVVRGEAMGPATLVKAQTSSPGVFDNSLAGTRVWFDGIAAPLVYTSATELAAIVPYEVAGKTSTKMQIEYLGAMSSPVTIPVVASAPGLFTADASGIGQVAETDYPAIIGTTFTLLVTGEGQTTPAGADGKIATTILPKPVLPVSVQIDGTNATVISAGAAPGMVAGSIQIVVLVPLTVTTGAQDPVVVTIGTVSSQAGATMWVAQPVLPPG
ncbi:MAG TPA: hypothetical protein VK335_29240 [Bryobacteraceae bacterium]|nr:hypothetical protein [Bryobacteraceae bacterium]